MSWSLHRLCFYHPWNQITRWKIKRSKEEIYLITYSDFPPLGHNLKAKYLAKVNFLSQIFQLAKNLFILKAFQIQTTPLPDYILQYRRNAFDLLNFQINVFSRSLMSKPNYSDGVSNGSGSPLSVPNGALAIPRARLTYSHSTCNTKHTILIVLQCVHILVCW